MVAKFLPLDQRKQHETLKKDLTEHIPMHNLLVMGILLHLLKEPQRYTSLPPCDQLNAMAIVLLAGVSVSPSVGLPPSGSSDGREEGGHLTVCITRM